MGLFSRTKKEVSTEPAPSPSEPEAKDRVRICEESLKTVCARRDAAVTALETADAKFRSADAAFEATAEAYRDDPGDKTAKAVREAREARELAELELARPRKARADADQDLEVAEAALEDARAEVARLENERRIAEAKTAASVARFHSVTRPLWERFIAAQSQMDHVLSEVVREFEAANAIADSLRAEGVDCPSLSNHQILACYCLLKAERDPELTYGYLQGLQLGENVPTHGVLTGTSLRDSLDWLVGPSRHIDNLRHRHGTQPVELERLQSLFADTLGQFAEREKLRAAKGEQERIHNLNEFYRDPANRPPMERPRRARQLVEGKS